MSEELVDLKSKPNINNSIIKPMSFNQRQIWYIQESNKNTYAYNSPTLIFLHGQLNINALEESFKVIIKRHEILRTNFDLLEGELIQVISSKSNFKLDYVDIRESNCNKEEVIRRSKLKAQEVFDLKLDSLIKVTVIHYEDDKYGLFINLHHIVSDGWFKHLFNELSTIYTSLIENSNYELPDLQLQYSDYAIWQHSMFNNNKWDEQLDYWKSNLKDLQPINLSQKTTVDLSYNNGKINDHFINKELVKKIEQIAINNQTSTFSIFLSAFKVLLKIYSNQDDISLGIPFGGRNLKGTENLIGYFVNPFVLRNNINSNDSLKQILYKVRKKLFEAIENKDVPFDRVLNTLNYQRDSKETLYNVVMNYNDQRYDQINLKGLSCEVVDINIDASKFDLNFYLLRNQKGVQAEIIYPPSLFDDEFISNMMENYIMILHQFVENINTKISQIELGYPENIESIYSNITPPLHKLFERQVNSNNDKIAIVCGSESITYSSLNTQSNKLANYLIKNNVTNTLVGVSLNRSIDLIVSILAILKTGSAYVPIDDNSPKDRINHIINDSKLNYVIVEDNTANNFPKNISLLNIKKTKNITNNISINNPDIDVNVNDLSYVIYTSGSTGKPKGVMNTHYNISSLLMNAKKLFSFSNKDVWSMFHSYAFDFSVWEIWGALAFGGKLVIVPKEITKSPNEFNNLLIQEEVTVLNQTPSAFYQLSDYLIEHIDLLNLRLIIFGGEALEFRKLSKWNEAIGLDGVDMVNMYGITETTVHVSYYFISEDDIREGNNSIIGKPLPGMQVYLLNKDLQHVPNGVIGEVFVAGTGLARGYINKQNITAERFLPNKYSEAGGRLYRTGDLAVKLRDGNYAYIGREDHQVKIRGFRIELGEIEKIILQDKWIKDVIVTTYEGLSGSTEIVAYLKSYHKNNQLNYVLKNNLPSYMIPKKLIYVNEFPLTTNGKIDFNNLPAPNNISTEKEFILPSNDIENSLCKIWKDILKLDNVGIYDNFFELGGDSILGMQMMSKAAKINLRITAKQLYENQTIKALSQVVKTFNNDIPEQGKVYGKVQSTPILKWFLGLNLENRSTWNQSELVELEPNIEPLLLKYSFDYLIEHHDMLRIRLNEKEKFEIIENENSDFFDYFDLSNLSYEEFWERVKKESLMLQSKLNIYKGPVIKVAYFDKGVNNRSYLLIIVHHIAIDGVSWDIILEDLQRAYWQLSIGERISFSHKTTSYKKYSEHLNNLANTKSLKDVDYWINELSDKNKTIYKDFECNKNVTEGSLKKINVELDINDTAFLVRDANKPYRTEVIDILLSALVVAYRKWSGEKDLLINTESHGRDQLSENIDLTRTVGWFTAIYPVSLKAQDSLEETLINTKEKIRELRNVFLSYPLLKYLSSSDYKDRMNGTAEVLFNYLGRNEGEFSLFKKKEFNFTGERDKQGEWPYFITIDCFIKEGKLKLRFSYCKDYYDYNSIKKLTAIYINTLKKILKITKSSEDHKFSSIDFPLAKLDDETLSKLNKILGTN